MEQHDDLLHDELGVSGLSWHRAELIAQKMRNLICVVEVNLEPSAAEYGELRRAQ